jgi:hypothetical protein
LSIAPKGVAACLALLTPPFPFNKLPDRATNSRQCDGIACPDFGGGVSKGHFHTAPTHEIRGSGAGLGCQNVFELAGSRQLLPEAAGIDRVKAEGPKLRADDLASDF